MADRAFALASGAESMGAAASETSSMVSSAVAVASDIDPTGTLGIAQDVLRGAFDIAEDVAGLLPGARSVLQICVGIYERFKAQRDLSETMDAALTFVSDVARHVARARDSFEWVDLSALREALEGVDGVADKIAKRGKFMAWWKAESDQVKLQECVAPCARRCETRVSARAWRSPASSTVCVASLLIWRSRLARTWRICAASCSRPGLERRSGRSWAKCWQTSIACWTTRRASRAT